MILESSGNSPRNAATVWGASASSSRAAKLKSPELTSSTSGRLVVGDELEQAAVRVAEVDADAGATRAEPWYGAGFDRDAVALDVELSVADAVRETAGPTLDDLRSDDFAVEAIRGVPVGYGDDAVVEMDGAHYGIFAPWSIQRPRIRRSAVVMRVALPSGIAVESTATPFTSGGER